MPHEFRKVGVVGLGTMGAGIVEVFARNGFQVVGVEVGEDALTRGRNNLSGSTDRAVARGKLSEQDRDALHARVSFSTEFTAVADCDLVVEAIPEHMDLKRDLFARLDEVVGHDAVLATNTSALSVTEIAVATRRPERVVGMHFFNPAQVQKFVEVIRTVVTAPDVFADVTALAERLGKTPVVVADKAGFIANALLLSYLNHAVSFYESRYATREDLDAAMTLGCGLPMGPLALMDLIGIDVAYQVLDTMYKQGRDRLHAPSPVLKHMISAGMLGRKTGRGFYTYAAPGSGKVVPDALTPPAASESDAMPAGRPVERIGVVGSGTMASGIAEVAAKAGYAVLLVARSDDKARAALAAVGASLAKAVSRGKLEQDAADAALARVVLSADRESLADCDLVIDAVAEDLAVKQDLFRDLDRICKPGAVLATTTSSLPVIECASVTSRPQDVVGLHFFNPAPVMRLVEVVRTVATGQDVLDTARAVCERLGRTPVSCTDRSGFIVNALLFPYLNDAVKMHEANYASVEDIDIAMTNGCGYPMGPFALLDVVGLDVALAIQRELYLEFREPGFAPAPLLEHLVTAGYLGRKAGRGFRSYA